MKLSKKWFLSVIRIKIILIITLAFYCNLSAQTIIESGEMGSFSEAVSFSVNQTGHFFVADIGSNEIYKLDLVGDELAYIGGYGWSEYSFDEPVNIFSTSLNVYVADKNNNRIQIFDKDLNYLSQFNTLDYEDQIYSFAYPTGVAVSTQGDLFVLDTDNYRILRYNLNGNFVQEIGGNDAGNFKLIDPIGFSVSYENFIYVIDQNNLLIFDQFGTGISKTDLPSSPINVNITGKYLVISAENKIYYSSLIDIRNQNYFVRFDEFDIDFEFSDALIYKGKLYTLTKESIIVFNIYP